MADNSSGETTGVVSIAGNVLFMWLLAGRAMVEPVIANLLAIALCSVVNFALSDRWTFAPGLSAGGAKETERQIPTERKFASCSGNLRGQAGVNLNN